MYLTTLISYSQVQTEINNRQTLVGGRYLIVESREFKKGDYGIPEDVSIIKNDFVEIIKEEGDNITFQSVNTKQAKEAKVDIFEQTLPKYLFFYYAKQQFQRYKGVSVGMYTVPYKLRIAKNCDFEAALSLSTNLAFGIGTRDSQESWLDASVGIGVTSINLTKDNSDATENRTATALTLSFGTVFKFAKNANLGLFLGGDFLNKNDRKMNWIYNEKLWVGVGINVAFSNASTKKEADNSKSNIDNITEVAGKKAAIYAKKTSTGGTPAGGTPAGGTPAGGTPAGGTI
ncbi:hypothetical protein [Flavobacterium sp. S87F.05.LMB.W.Kidney.N]|uniref:hypothetical protein n=1 Tax=Flavobacterium sp. S87F.05.LMB.W.Kidney.N TaxID=1278758 RepID=UPI001065111D|nr:hypothetical protein [Flavobacterium sp. S87F.05.LMB.W.Kidney.N]TDX11306.1 hypothetical protein EDB96_2091 [Flavobacterium sp. S87F.05.LMB.W.Kidney.N]